MKIVKKISIPCQSCGKIRMIDSCKISYDKYIQRSPLCRSCKAKTPQTSEKISKGWFKKGHIPWLTGMKSPIGNPWNKGMKGLVMSPNSINTRFKRGDTAGENNRNWKGGISSLNQQIRHLPEYKKWVTDILVRDDYTCINCNNRGCVLHADHIIPYFIIRDRYNIDSVQKAIECKQFWDTNNGRTLCVPCHKNTDSYGSKGLTWSKELRKKETYK